MLSGSLLDADVAGQTMLQLTHSLSGSKGTLELINRFYSSPAKFQVVFTARQPENSKLDVNHAFSVRASTDVSPAPDLDLERMRSRKKLEEQRLHRRTEFL